jgi:uncharacterized paraquat-inducible protein A
MQNQRLIWGVFILGLAGIAVLLLLRGTADGAALSIWVLALIVPLMLIIFLRGMFEAIAEGDVKIRGALGQCLHCGYDLKGNASGVCPECGTAIEAAANAAPRQIPPEKPRLSWVILVCQIIFVLMILSAALLTPMAREFQVNHGGRSVQAAGQQGVGVRPAARRFNAGSR